MGNGSQAAARIDHGPIAMMTALASITAPSTSTPVTRPAVCRMPVTVPRRNSAPCASAARIVAAVNKAGLRGAPGRAELLADLEMRRHPIYGVRGRAAAGVRRRGADAAISRDAAVTPSLAAVLGEFCVQIEAVACELLQWRAGAPMAREKAAGI